MKYAITTNLEYDDGTKTTEIVVPEFSLSKKTFKEILKSVPKIEDKIEN